MPPPSPCGEMPTDKLFEQLKKGKIAQFRRELELDADLVEDVDTDQI